MLESEIVYTRPKYVGLVLIALLVIMLTCYLAWQQFLNGPELGVVVRALQSRGQNQYTTIVPMF